jgi:hypothetical protein
MYSDATPDYLRMTALNVPAALLVLGFLFSIDDITGGCLDSLRVRVCVVLCGSWARLLNSCQCVDRWVEQRASVRK